LASASTSLYKITLTNFLKHNSSLKTGHKKTLISNNFCSDPKLGVLPLTVRWLFLGIVLTCGDYTSDTVEMNERQLRELLESSWSVDRALESLQQIQVLTFTKIDLFIIEKKIKENNRKEKNISTEPQKAVAVVTPKILISITENKKVEVTNDLIKSWADTYPKEYLELEIKKARNWLLANPHKMPKSNFGRFFNSWFDRGWEAYRKNLTSNQTTTSVDELMNFMGWDNA